MELDGEAVTGRSNRKWPWLAVVALILHVAYLQVRIMYLEQRHERLFNFVVDHCGERR